MRKVVKFPDSLAYSQTEKTWLLFCANNGEGMQDIFKTVERLYRGRVLVMDHILVLRHYGKRQVPPDARRLKEARAATIWEEAIKKLSGRIHGPN